ncbi:hypothetical protein [Comamonas kerstersii]|uniref:hypothetical protein n=1 Tax=Comamonas kerstersii TaxID=225992 RepID=UPI001B31DF52|nr:hypothetical protein [Comamonas kerstersii]QTW17827.1 hypothetical protein H8N02_11295 [Comamonas kerstersii]
MIADFSERVGATVHVAVTVLATMFRTTKLLHLSGSAQLANIDSVIARSTWATTVVIANNSNPLPFFKLTHQALGRAFTARQAF